MLERGIRAYIGKLSMDISSRPTYKEADARSSLASVASFADKCHALTKHLPEHDKIVEPILTPRFVPTCSNDLLKGLGELSKDRGLKVQSHLAEAHDQVQWVKKERGLDDIEVFEQVCGTCFQDDRYFIAYISTHSAWSLDLTYNSSSLHLSPTAIPPEIG